MNREDWLLMLIGADGPDGAAPMVDRVRAMKCLFILGERRPQVKESAFYNFKPYNYGPFDSSVYDDARKLVHAGLVQESTGKYTSYQATPGGRQRANELAKQNPELSSFLLRVRSWANGVSFADLLKAVYDEWPEFRAKSVFVG